VWVKHNRDYTAVEQCVKYDLHNVLGYRRIPGLNCQLIVDFIYSVDIKLRWSKQITIII